MVSSIEAKLNLFRQSSRQANQAKLKALFSDQVFADFVRAVIKANQHKFTVVLFGCGVAIELEDLLAKLNELTQGRSKLNVELIFLEPMQQALQYIEKIKLPNYKNLHLQKTYHHQPLTPQQNRQYAAQADYFIFLHPEVLPIQSVARTHSLTRGYRQATFDLLCCIPNDGKPRKVTSTHTQLAEAKEMEAILDSTTQKQEISSKGVVFSWLLEPLNLLLQFDFSTWKVDHNSVFFRHVKHYDITANAHALTKAQFNQREILSGYITLATAFALFYDINCNPGANFIFDMTLLLHLAEASLLNLSRAVSLLSMVALASSISFFNCQFPLLLDSLTSYRQSYLAEGGSLSDAEYLLNALPIYLGDLACSFIPYMAAFKTANRLLSGVVDVGESLYGYFFSSPNTSSPIERKDARLAMSARGARK